MVVIPEEEILITGGLDGKLQVWDINTRIEKQVFPNKTSPASPINQLLIIASKKLLIACLNSGVGVYQYGNGKLEFQRVMMGSDKFSLVTTYLKQHDCLVSIGEKNIVKFWNYENGSSINSWDIKNVSCCCELYGINKVVLGTEGKMIMLDITSIKKESKQNFKYFEVLAHKQAKIRCLNWIESQNMLISGSHDETIKVWKVTGSGCTLMTTLTLKSPLNKDVEGCNHIRCVIPILEKDVLLSTHNGNFVAIWKMSSWELISADKLMATFTEGNGNCLAYDPVNEVIFGAFQSSISIWNWFEKSQSS